MTRPDGKMATYTYDAVGNLISQVTTGKYDVSLNYTYDLSGRMISESRTENGAAVESSYIYDAIGQLTEFTRSDGIAESYAYDPAGNMLSKTAGGIKMNYTYNAGNQLVGDGTYNYTYDKIGNLVEKAGNGGQVSYTYNALNLLEKWTDGENTETYTYNAAGLLSTVNTNSSTTTLTWDILYGDGVVISSVKDGETTDYTYGLERISASTGKSRTEYVYDGRGSVIGEVTKSGFLSPAKVTTKAYTPFGEQIGEATSGFGWNGEYYNANTGMVYLRARFYEPEMNRFSQKDILRGSTVNALTQNRYLYCYNDPLNYIDPSGKIGILAAAAIVGGIVGGVVGAVKNVKAQKVASPNTKVNVKQVIKSAAIGAAAGAVGAAIATATATAIVASVATTTITGAASLTVAQSIGVSAISAATGGAASRYTTSVLNNTYSPEKPKTNPLQEATNPSAVLTDMAFGGALGAITHFATGGIYETPASRNYEESLHNQYGSGSKKSPMGDSPEVEPLNGGAPSARLNCSINQSEETVELYRAVGVNEYNDIMTSGQIRPASSGMSLEAKEFGNSFEETLEFANQGINTDKVAIVKVTIPKSLYDKLSDLSLDKNIFKSGTVIVEPELLDEFNSGIINIQQVY